MADEYAAVAAQWSQPLTDACTAFGISTPKRVAAFLAQVGHESASLTRTVENLNYGAQGMADTWPSRYAVDPKAKPRKPNDLARALERKPVAIENNAYAIAADRLLDCRGGQNHGWSEKRKAPG
ncbi:MULTISPECIES: hypothetical protein [unclassified Stenotrophomonas]|uniref:hypothetical protein n=1 Tax=unclassified Stenotrophomonas TaxID=196198 RepID=UPI0015E6E05A|nr:MULTISPECIES: hypothetical protein [unclassified Stenotrophomonas]